MLQINNITYRIGDRVLFENATLSIPIGQKLGLIGRNGTGKTTLFRLIMGEIEPNNGTILRNQGIKIGTVAQDPPNGTNSLIETVLEADQERDSLLKESITATDPSRISEIHSRLADIEAHTAPSRAAAILAGLGFDEYLQKQSCQTISGGMRMRIALAATLFTRPDLLLLDEPTNHLDLESVMWLENYLVHWEGTLILISHERSLLNNIVSSIAHLENKKFRRYTGGYDDFERIRREKISHEKKLYAKQRVQRKRILKFVERFRYKATKARQAQSRLKMLERIEPIASVIEEKTVSFDFPQPKLLSPPLITTEHLQVGYDGKVVLSDLNFRIDLDDRIALIGPNGNGKSTLMKLLGERLKPISGKLVKSKKLQVGYFAQHQTEELSANLSAFEHLQKLFPDQTETRLRSHLGRFGFEGKKADTKAMALSGGEKTRLLFCLITQNNPQVILLDEPTNHLDVDSREALIEALNTFEGAIILVSHDSHLIRLVADQLWLLENGRCLPFKGDLGDYEDHLLKNSRGNHSKDAKHTLSVDRKKIKSSKQHRPMRKNISKLKLICREAEKNLEQLSNEKNNLESELAKTDTYKMEAQEIISLQKELGTKRKALAEAEARWLDAQNNLESEGQQD